MLDRKILKIAKACRIATEEITANSSLECCCAIASVALFFSLKHFGYNPIFIIGNYKDLYVDHCWIELNNKIIDLTETQFGSKKKVAIYNLNNSKYKEKHSMFQGKLDFSFFEDWPKDQKPIRKLTKEVLKKL